MAAPRLSAAYDCPPPASKRKRKARPGAGLSLAEIPEWSVVERFLDGILDAADGVLHFAGDLVGLAFGLELGVAGHFARDFLDFAFRLFGRAFDPILVHNVLFLRSGSVIVMTTTSCSVLFHVLRMNGATFARKREPRAGVYRRGALVACLKTTAYASMIATIS
jgi:hypothetical protein